MKMFKFLATRVVLITALFLGIFAGVCQAITIDATYTGATGGNWSDADNWDVSVVPGNAGPVKFNVTIPAGITVNYDVVGDTEIDTLILGDATTNDARLNFNAGCNLKVLNETDIYGIIDGDGNNFTATGTASALEGDRVMIFGENGAIIELTDDIYSSKGIWRSWDPSGSGGDQVGIWEPIILKSSGEGTLLDFSSFITFDASFNASGNDFNYQRVIAENGGEIDFSNLQNYFSPLDSRSRVKFEVMGGNSELSLDSLGAIADATVSSYYHHGSTYFFIDGSFLSLPLLELVQQTHFELSNAATLNLPLISTMEDTQFDVSGGSIVHDGTGPAAYSTLNIWRSWDPSGSGGDQVGTWESVILHSSGAGSLMDLSSVETLNAGFNAAGNDYNYQNIIVDDSATIDLSGLLTITGPVYSRGRLKISVTGADTELKLNSLSDIIGSYSGSYYYFSKVPFFLDSTTVSVPALDNLEQVSFSLSDGSSLELPAVKTMQDTQFDISGGSIVHDGTGPAAYSTLNIWRSWDPSGSGGDQVGTWEPVILQSSGAGSLLDLSSVETLNAGFNAAGNDYNYQSIIVDDSAALDLSGLLTITGPVYSRGRLKISVTGADTELKLNSLSDIIGSYSGSYYYFSKVPFFLDSTTVSMPALDNVEQVSFSLSNGSSLELPAVKTMQDTQFDISGGSIVHDGTGPAAYSTLNIWRSWDPSGSGGDQVGTWEPVILQSSGAGSLLDLSSVETLNAGFNAGGNDHIYQKIIADDEGAIDLSGVETITAPFGSDDKLNISISDGASIDLRSLTAINSESAGDVNVTINSGELLLGNIQFNANATITIDGGSYFYAAGLSASSPVTLKISDPEDRVEIDGNLDLSNLLKIDSKDIGFTLKLGGSFTYDYTDETEVELGDATIHLDGSGADQILEVGGLDVDVLVQFLTNDNFGFGQLIVGQDSQTTVARLRDAVDNGNIQDWCDQPEALYLFGVEGDNPNGLRILGGSTLILDGINLYAYQEGAWVHINSLFASDADEFTEIAFDGGKIRKGKLDADGDGLVNQDDNCIVTYNPLQEDKNDDGYGDVCDYDFNNDELVDSKDLALFAADFGRTDCTGSCIGNSDDDADIDGIDVQAIQPIGKSLKIGIPGPICF